MPSCSRGRPGTTTTMQPSSQNQNFTLKSLMCEVSKQMIEGGVAGLQYIATRLQAVLGKCTPTATSIHQFNLADHQHEVTELAHFGVDAAGLLSDGGPCEGFRESLEDDRAWRPWRLMEDIWVSSIIGRVC
jgi:hypothetical protein